MINIAEEYLGEYNEAVRADERRIKARLAVGNNDMLDGSHLMSLSLSEAINSGNNISMGCTCSAELNFSFLMPTETSDPENRLPLYGSTLKPEIGVELEDGTVYWLPMGVFYPLDITSSDGYRTVNVKAYDGYSKMSKVFDGSALEWPAKIADIAELIATNCQIELADYDWNPYDEYEIPDGAWEEAYTYQAMIGYIAGMMGKNARFNRQGELEFTWYQDRVLQIDRSMQYQGGFTKLTEDVYKVYSIRSGVKDNIYEAGQGTGISFDNPFITQEMVDTICTEVEGMIFQPCSVKWRGNPALQAGDVVGVVDPKGGEHWVLVMAQKLTVDGGMMGEITCNGETEAKQVMMAQGPTARQLDKVYRGLQAAFEKLVGSDEGYVWFDYNEFGYPCAICISASESDEEEPPQDRESRHWRWDLNGLRWTENGGATWSKVAITSDGEIDANYIKAGSLHAEQIVIGEGDNDTLGNIIRMEDGVIHISGNNADVMLRMGNDKIAFVNKSGEEIAYFAHDALVINDTNIVRFGNFMFVPRTNGNLTFTKVGN